MLLIVKFEKDFETHFLYLSMVCNFNKAASILLY